MTCVAAIGALPADPPHAHARWDARHGCLPGSWRRPCWLGRPRLISGVVPTRIHPDRARRVPTSWASCPAPRRGSPATARANPKQSAATGTTGEPRGIGPTDAMLSHSRRRRDFHRRRRQARSGASREVWSPTALAGRSALSGGCQPSGRSRFGVFAAGPRAFRRPKIGGVRPCGFALEASVGRCRWCGGRVRGSHLPDARAPFDSDRSRCSFRTPIRLRQPAQARLLLSHALIDRPFHISRRRLAPARFDADHSPRPFLARGVPDPSLEPPRPGRAVRFLPSFRPAALLGFRPSQGCSRTRVDDAG